MIKIYGHSDDLVEIEGSGYIEDEICCFDHDVIIEFYDGTVIRIGYNKPNLAIWYINIEKQGTALHRLTVCNDEEADIYSDVFEIAGTEIETHRFVERRLRDEEERGKD